MSDQTYFKNIMERIDIVIVWIVLGLLLLLNSINLLAFFIIGGTVSVLMFQFKHRARYMLMQMGRAEKKAQKNKLKQGVMSVRAQALDNIPTPILIIADDYSISFANHAARMILGQYLENHPIFDHLKNTDIKNALTKTIEKGTLVTDRLRYQTQDERSFDVTIQPIAKKSDIKNSRAIVFFYEVTRLLKTERMRVDFVANASHELRTPLSSMIGFIETLQGPAKGDEAASERFLGIMQNEAERMSRLIEDLLSLSHIEMERHNPPSDMLDVPALLKSTTHSLRPKAEARGITFDVDIEEDLPAVIADSDQILQVLINLAANACKYATENTTVIVGARRSALDKVTIFVKDQGPGIAQEHQQRLTERFYRVDTARSRKMGGTGLGLAIVKHILLRHKSTLDLESNEESGSCFSFALPLNPNLE